MPKTLELKQFFCLPTAHLHPVAVLRMFLLLMQAHVRAVTVTYLINSLYSLTTNMYRKVLGSIPERRSIFIDHLWPFITNLLEIFHRVFLFL